MLPHFPASVPRKPPGFTLVEILCSTAIFLIVLVLITAMVQRTTMIWRSSADEHQSFQEAQRALSAISRHLEQATLNTYWATFDSAWNPLTGTNNTTFVPVHYGRMSELHFVAGQTSDLVGPAAGPGTAVFFTAPEGYSRAAAYSKTENALNACGYWVQFGTDTSEMPDFVKPLITPQRRFRLMELLQPTEDLTVYANQSDDTFTSWFSGTNAMAAARPIANNIVLLVIRWFRPGPNGSELASYDYNSRTRGVSEQPDTQHQLPPRADITVVALDEASAIRAEQAAGTGAPALVEAGRFTVADDFAADLDALEKSLAEKGYRFHVFSSAVFLKSAKWSSR